MENKQAIKKEFYNCMSNIKKQILIEEYKQQIFSKYKLHIDVVIHDAQLKLNIITKDFKQREDTFKKMYPIMWNQIPDSFIMNKYIQLVNK